MTPFLVPSLQQSIFPIGFGGAAISGEGGGYGFGSVSEEEAEKLIRGAIERGINLFDTAPIYGFGLSEQRLGRFLKSSDDVFVVSKGGVDWHSNQRVNMSNHPDVIKKMLHESLKRIDRDCIDMYMIHWPDPKIDIRKPLEVLYKAQEVGKIRFIGLANTNTEDLSKSREIVEVKGFQAEHSAWVTTHAELAGKELFMGWGTFDKGILSGRVTADRRYESDDARSWAPWWNKKQVLKKIEQVELLKDQLSRYSLTLPEFALHYALSSGDSICSLVGIKSLIDLDQIITSLNKGISKELIQKIYSDWKNSIPEV